MATGPQTAPRKVCKQLGELSLGDLVDGSLPSLIARLTELLNDCESKGFDPEAVSLEPDYDTRTFEVRGWRDETPDEVANRLRVASERAARDERQELLQEIEEIYSLDELRALANARGEDETDEKGEPKR